MNISHNLVTAYKPWQIIWSPMHCLSPFSFWILTSHLPSKVIVHIAIKTHPLVNENYWKTQSMLPLSQIHRKRFLVFVLNGRKVRLWIKEIQWIVSILEAQELTENQEMFPSKESFSPIKLPRLSVKQPNPRPPSPKASGFCPDLE